MPTQIRLKREYIPRDEESARADEALANASSVYFDLLEAADILLSYMEANYARYGVGINGLVKKRHKMLMDNMRQAKALFAMNQDIYNEMYVEIDPETKKQSFKKVPFYSELARRWGAFFAELGLFVGDRCGEGSDWARENLIVEFIEAMPEHGAISPKMIEHIRKLRKSKDGKY